MAQKHFDKERHESLLQEVASVKPRRDNAQIRTRVAKINKVAEFAAVDNSRKVTTLDLTLKLPESVKTAAMKNQLRRAHKVKQTVAVPLAEFEKTQTIRGVTYNRTVEHVAKWDKVVERNREANQLRFPLGPSLRPDNMNTVTGRLQSRSDMEIEIDRLLQQGSYEKKLKSQTDKFEKERRQEMRKVHKLQTFYNNLAKRRYLRVEISNTLRERARQKKIKSKGYHRFHKKQEKKEKEKHLSNLRETDPSAYLAELRDVDRLRIKERMSLKHKFKSRRLRKQLAFGKHGGGGSVQQLINQMVEKNQELTRKQLIEESDDDDVDDRAAVIATRNIDASNPWMSAQLKNVVVAAHASGRTDGSNAIATKKPTVATARQRYFNAGNEAKPSTVVADDADEDDDDMDLQLSTTRRQAFEDFEGDWHEEENYATSTAAAAEAGAAKRSRSQPATSPGPISADEQTAQKPTGPAVQSSLKTDVDVTMFVDDDDDDDTEQHRLTLAEAFASDDVVAEFEATKRAQEAEERPKDVVTALPGWGQWGGAGLEMTKRKLKKNTLKAPKLKRLDGNKRHVIIREDAADAKMADHKLAKVPRMFTNAETYEAYIRQPVGKTWNPETTFQQLTKPKVVTKRGQIIDPLPEDTIAEREEQRQHETVVKLKKKQEKRKAKQETRIIKRYKPTKHVTAAKDVVKTKRHAKFINATLDAANNAQDIRQAIDAANNAQTIKAAIARADGKDIETSVLAASNVDDIRAAFSAADNYKTIRYSMRRALDTNIDEASNKRTGPKAKKKTGKKNVVPKQKKKSSVGDSGR